MKAKPGSGGADKNTYYKSYKNSKGTNVQVLGNLKTGVAKIKTQSPNGSTKYELPSETWADQAKRRDARGAEGPKKRVAKKAVAKKTATPRPKKK